MERSDKHRNNRKPRTDTKCIYIFRQHNLRANYREERELRRCFAAFAACSMQQTLLPIPKHGTSSGHSPSPFHRFIVCMLKKINLNAFVFRPKSSNSPHPHIHRHTHSWCINNVLFSDTSRQYKHLQRGGERAPAQHLCVQGAHLSLQPIRSHRLSARRDRWLRLGR